MLKTSIGASGSSGRNVAPHQVKIQDSHVLPLNALMPSVFKKKAATQQSRSDTVTTTKPSSRGRGRKHDRQEIDINDLYASYGHHHATAEERSSTQVHAGKQSMTVQQPSADQFLNVSTFEELINLAATENVILEGTVPAASNVASSEVFNQEPQPADPQQAAFDEKKAQLELLSMEVDDMSEQEYRRWLDLNLKLNPNCVSYFALDQDQFHKLLTQFCKEFVKKNQEVVDKENSQSKKIVMCSLGIFRFVQKILENSRGCLIFQNL